MKLNPLNEKILPPKAMSLSTCIFEAVIAPLALIEPATDNFSPGEVVPIPTLPSS